MLKRHTQFLRKIMSNLTTKLCATNRPVINSTKVVTLKD